MCTMDAKTGGFSRLLMIFAVSSLAASTVFAVSVDELERRIDVLAHEIERLKLEDLPSSADRSERGMGPAATKVYRVSHGVSIGGYGEALYRNFEGDKTDEADFLRAVLYAGYKFSDKWLFNSELELEHASTGEEGSSSVEFAYLDYLHSSALNIRAGLVLIPMGFLNELHEPTTFLSATRPDIEGVIIPTTWRENGLGIYGDVGDFTYRTYVVTGLKGEVFTSKGLRGGRQKGSKSEAEDFAWVGRLDFSGIPKLLVGGSVYLGNSGQSLMVDGDGVDAFTQIYEAHSELNIGGLNVRLMGTFAAIDDVDDLNRNITASSVKPDGSPALIEDVDSVGEELYGWYVQLGYDVLSRSEVGEMSLTLYGRYEQLDTQDKVPGEFENNPSTEVETWTIGLNFKPIDQVVFKAEYQGVDRKGTDSEDQINLAMGYVF